MKTFQPQTCNSYLARKFVIVVHAVFIHTHTVGMKRLHAFIAAQQLPTVFADGAYVIIDYLCKEKMTQHVYYEGQCRLNDEDEPSLLKVNYNRGLEEEKRKKKTRQKHETIIATVPTPKNLNCS